VRDAAAFPDPGGSPDEAAKANLRRLTEVARALNSEPDLHSLLDVILDRVVEFARAERAFLVLRRDERRLTVAASRNLDREAVQHASSKISRSIVLQTERSGRPVLTTNATMDPRFATSESVAHMRLRAVLCVPLVVRGRSLGVLYLDNRFETGVFRDVDLDLMEAFGAQAAIALENAQYQEAARERARDLERELAGQARAERRLSTQNAVTRLMSEVADPADALPRLLRCIAQGIGWDLGGAWKVDEPAGVLRPLLVWHAGDEDLERFAEDLRARTFARGQGMPGRAWASSTAEWCTDIAKDLRHPREGAAAAGLHGAVAAPVTVDGAVRGVVAFLSRKAVPPDPELLSLMGGIGIQLGQFVERKDAEKARARAEAMFRQSQKMEAIGRLAGGVAHDFNNLLTVITGFSYLALSEVHPDDPVRQHLKEVDDAAHRASALTRQLLAFSRQQVLETRILDLREIVLGMEKLLHRILGEDIELAVETDGDASGVRGDPGQIEQVLLNLAVNARDAMPEGGRIVVRTGSVRLDEEALRARASDGRPGPYAFLEVEDGGTGIDPAVLPHIFEPFFTTKEEGKGTGLGLATVYGIVSQSGGHLSVRSEPGKGSTFRALLPRDESAPEAADGRTAAAAPRTGNESLLVAEDDPQLRDLTRRFLERAGYRVRLVGDAETALEAAADPALGVDLLLTDVVMPRMNGIELARRLREIRPGVRVLFMSGYTGRALEGRGVTEGGLDFVEKPFSAETLAAKVRAVLDAAAPAG
jgi:signal transduction histidine kinase/CheY-like chemotaxis protein